MKISDFLLLSSHSYFQNILRSSNTLDRISMAAYQQHNSDRQCAWSVSTQLTIKYRLLSMKRNSTVRDLQLNECIISSYSTYAVCVQWTRTESKLLTLLKNGSQISLW